MGGGYQQTLREGQTAPDVPFRRLDGSTVRLAELASAGSVLLAFYKDTCPVCQLTLPYLERIREGKLKLYAVSQDDAARTRAFARDYGISFDLLIDPADGYVASNAFGITHVPSMFVVQPDMRISWVSNGFVRVDMGSLGEIAGRPVLRESDNVPAAKPG
jgi:peroxiredoxin